VGGLPSQVPSSSQVTGGVQDGTSSVDSKSSGRKPLPVVRDSLFVVEYLQVPIEYRHCMPSHSELFQIYSAIS
jgi:hypothetical protein